MAQIRPPVKVPCLALLLSILSAATALAAGPATAAQHPETSTPLLIMVVLLGTIYLTLQHQAGRRRWPALIYPAPRSRVPAYVRGRRTCSALGVHLQAPADGGGLVEAPFDDDEDTTAIRDTAPHRPNDDDVTRLITLPEVVPSAMIERACDAPDETEDPGDGVPAPLHDRPTQPMDLYEQMAHVVATYDKDARRAVRSLTHSELGYAYLRRKAHLARETARARRLGPLLTAGLPLFLMLLTGCSGGPSITLSTVGFVFFGSLCTLGGGLFVWIFVIGRDPEQGGR